MSRGRVAVVFVLLAAAVVAPAVAATPAAGVGSPVPTPDANARADVGVPQSAAVPAAPPARLASPANATVRLQLYANASARWEITLVYALDSSDERAAFREFADEYRAGATDAGPSIDTYRTFAALSANETGRQMRVRSAGRHANVTATEGTISLSFLWTGFLNRTENGTLRFADATAIGGNRSWLGTLGPDQTLVVQTPPGYSIVDSGGPAFDIQNNALVIEGPRDLDGDLQVTYRPTSPAWPSIPLAPAVALAVVAVVALGAWRLRDRLSALAAGVATEADASSEPEPDEEPDTDPAGGTEATGSADETEIDVDLLSDEERVEYLLEQRGGRMKQATIVEETGWSDAKVSQLLSTMADEGRIDKLRIGRENLISLPDEEESAPMEHGQREDGSENV